MAATNPWTPDARYEALLPKLRVMSDIVDGGTHRLRVDAKTYLPQFPSERKEDYERRVSTATLFNATRRTVEGTTAMLFRKPPTFQADETNPILGHLADVDLEGARVNVWLKQWVRMGNRDGMVHALVDMTRTEGATDLSREDVAVRGLRPYWVRIPAAALIGWASLSEDGHRALVQIRYIEALDQPDGAYGSEAVARLRVLTRPTEVDETGRLRLVPGAKVQFEVYERTVEGGTDSGDTGKLVESGEMDIETIPLVTFYSNRQGFLDASPPYLDLAYQNIRHTQAMSTSDRGIDVGQYAILAIKGMQGDGPIDLGPFSAIKVSEEGDLKWVEIAGSALSAASDRIEHAEKIMSTEGLSQLHSDTRAAETARSKEIDRAEQNSVLEALAEDLQDAVDTLLAYHAMWLDVEAPTASVNKDFDSLQLEPPHVAQLREMAEAQIISREALLDALKRGEWLPDNYDAEEDLVKILADVENNLSGVL